MILSLSHENVAGIDEIFRKDDDPEKELCYTMEVAWYGSLMDKIVAYNMVEK